MLGTDLHSLVNLSSGLLDLVGLLLVFFGAIQAVYLLFLIEIGKNENKFKKYENTKRIFIQKLIFSLDFFVAADLLKLVYAPSQEEVFLIAATVAIRTVLSYSLSREVHLHSD